MPIGPTLEVQEDLQVILTGVEDNTQEILDGERGDITVSSSGNVWTLNKNAILNKTTEPAVGTDYILISDTSDSGNIKKALASDLISGLSGDITGLQTALLDRVFKGGDVMSGSLGMGNNVIYNLGAPINNDHATNKSYVDLLELKTRIRNAGLINGFIRVTVASNNLTVAISTSPTSQVDPTATNPVYVFINGVLRSITGALSLTRNAGTNWFNSGSAELATKEIDYFVYMGYNATDGVTLGFSRIPYARLYSDFNTTTTNERHCAISTITNAASGDNYVNIGRFAATLSAGAGYTWTVPAFTNANLIQEPIYETRWLVYTPSITGTGGSIGTFAYIDRLHRYQITNKTTNFVSKFAITNKGSWSGAFDVSIPISVGQTNKFMVFTGFVVANTGNPATGSRGTPFFLIKSYEFTKSINSSAVVWSDIAVNDEVDVQGFYEI